MTDLLIVASNIVFIITMFKFTEHVHGQTSSNKHLVLAIAVLNNFIFLVLFNIFTTIHLEIILLMFYFAIYYIEFKLLYKQLGKRIVFFGVLSFLLTHFSGRLLITSLCAFFTGLSMYDVYEIEFYNLLINLIPVFTSIPYFIIIQKKFHKEKFDMIFTDKINLNFIIGMLSFTLMHLFFLLGLSRTPHSNSNFLLFYIISSFISFVCIHLAVLYSYVFAKLRLYVANLKDINKKVLLETQEIGDIHLRSNFDAMSGFCVRDMAEKQIQENLDNNTEFFIVFVDMDGLKKVNDSYGHSEGDFYIKEVCEMLREFFSEELISRLGGDEFLIVGTENDMFEINKKIMQAYSRIKNIANLYKKHYHTSISYGIVAVPKNSDRTVKSIISEADEKMYDFKKSKNRQRL